MARPLILAAAALAALTVLRLGVAAVVPLSPDETYYFVWSRALAAGYLDHPPMVALWIRAGTALLGDSALGIRLLAPLATALGSILFWQAAARLTKVPLAGLRATFLLNATLAFGIGATTLTPDTPLIFFWVCALWALALVVTGGPAACWLLVGLFTGLALASKYTAAFLPIGIALWLLLSGRHWLLRPWPWLAATLTLLVMAPVLWWNAAHDWVSFAKQGGRIDHFALHRAAQYLLELIGGQLGLATPLVLILCVAGTAAACRRAWRTRDPGMILLVTLVLPPVLVFIEHATGDRVQGNWPAIVYPAAVIAAVSLTAPAWRRLVWPATGLGLVITLLVYLQAAYAALPLPIRYDVTALQLAGWPDLVAKAEAARAHDGDAFLAADQYGVASELGYRAPSEVPVVAVGGRWDLFALPHAAIVDQAGIDQPGILLRSTRRGPISDTSTWKSSVLLGEIQRTRAGAPIETYYLYRVTGLQPGASAALLPHPEAGAR